mmetsp:Transcript_7556/g.23497  ORF Transcript_7556/g.23497 Transcript_7556/m.23497 type:complete len:223 (-) Transcript_7556:713-1381(-)|eukprot:scaffold150295_cov31-Tisochrysis_lutea.AAC.2
MAAIPKRRCNWPRSRLGAKTTSAARVPSRVLVLVHSTGCCASESRNGSKASLSTTFVRSPSSCARSTSAWSRAASAECRTAPAIIRTGRAESLLPAKGSCNTRAKARSCSWWSFSGRNWPMDRTMSGLLGRGDSGIFSRATVSHGGKMMRNTADEATPTSFGRRVERRERRLVATIGSRLEGRRSVASAVGVGTLRSHSIERWFAVQLPFARTTSALRPENQ